MRAWVMGAPGLEAALRDELVALGLPPGVAMPGGVQLDLDGAQLLRANRWSRCATRIMVRLGSFKAVHLSELTRRAASLAWGEFLAPGQRVSVRASCRASRIYHSGAAAERVAQAVVRAGGVLAAADGDQTVGVLVRLQDNLCEVSIDSSGAPLYARGYKLQTAKAPLRESLAAALLRLAAWDPGEPLLDPMCGSGTFVLEAASRLANRPPGGARRFACEGWPCMAHASGDAGTPPERAPSPSPTLQAPRLFAFDRDAGAAAATLANATRAGLAPYMVVGAQPLRRLTRPAGPPGLVVCNPPYGRRIGDARQLRDLYAALGNSLRHELVGWRLALVTATPSLAHATGLALTASAPLPHGGLKIRLYLSEGRPGQPRSAVGQPPTSP